MILLRRLFLVGSIVVTGSLALAAAAIAGGGGGQLGPGKYAFTDTTALAEFGTPITPNSPPQFIISLDRNHSDFRPTSGPHVVTNATTVNIQISTAAINGVGCFTIPTSDFPVSSDLQNAALHATLVTPCPGSDNSSLPASIAVDVTWTGDGVVGTTRDANSFQCAGFTLNRLTISRAASVTGSGTVSSPSTGTLLPLSPADATSLRSSQIFMNITGAELNACASLQ